MKNPTQDADQLSEKDIEELRQVRDLLRESNVREWFRKLEKILQENEESVSRI